MWQPRVVSVTTHPTSAAAEQVHLEGQAKSPYGEFVTRILNISSDFDMEKDSFAHGTSTGLLIAEHHPRSVTTTKLLPNQR